jgi:hypothetical protein
MNSKTMKSLLISIGLGLTSQVHAGDCTAMIDDLMNWVKNPQANYYNQIGVTMTSNVNTRKFASYSTSIYMSYYPAKLLITGYLPERLIGEGKTYFSDRTWNHPIPGCTGFFCNSAEPFNPDTTDKLRITLKKHATNSTLANVTLTLLSWGNAQLNFNASCNNGHIYGFKTDQHGTHLYDLTFTKEQFAIPK